MMAAKNNLSMEAKEVIRSWARLQPVPGNRLVFGDAIYKHANGLWKELVLTVTRNEAFFVSRVLTAMSETLEMARQCETCGCLEALAIHLCFHNVLRRTGGRPWIIDVLTREGEVATEDIEELDEFVPKLGDLRKMDREHRKRIEQRRLDFIRGARCPRTA